MPEHRLTQWEATSLMVGAGVGAGIMAVPFLTERVGLMGLVIDSAGGLGGQFADPSHAGRSAVPHRAGSADRGIDAAVCAARTRRPLAVVGGFQFPEHRLSGKPRGVCLRRGRDSGRTGGN